MASQNQAHSRRKEASHNGDEHIRNRRNEILHETMEEFKEHRDDVKALISEYVQQKPFKSLGVAMLTGVALALVLKR